MFKVYLIPWRHSTSSSTDPSVVEAAAVHRHGVVAVLLGPKLASALTVHGTGRQRLSWDLGERITNELEYGPGRDVE
jgi:hypothetical protein